MMVLPPVYKRKIAKEFLIAVGVLVATGLTAMFLSLRNSYYERRLLELPVEIKMKENLILSLQKNSNQEASSRDELDILRDELWTLREDLYFIQASIEDQSNVQKKTLSVTFFLVVLLYPIRFILYGIFWSIKVIRGQDQP